MEKQLFRRQQRTVMQKACFAGHNDPLHGVQDVCRKYRIEFGMIWVALNFPGTTFPRTAKDSHAEGMLCCPEWSFAWSAGSFCFWQMSTNVANRLTSARKGTWAAWGKPHGESLLHGHIYRQARSFAFEFIGSVSLCCWEVYSICTCVILYRTV